MSHATMQINTCHMVTIMVHLAYGDERKLNDGGRVTPASQKAWMEPVHQNAPFQTNRQRQRVLLCSEVEERRSLHHFTNQVAYHHSRGSTTEDRGFRRSLSLSAVREQIAQSFS